MSTLPPSMTAIAIARPGGPDVLVAKELPVPQPSDGEVLIKVAAAGVNRPDVLQRQGLYPAPKGHSELPGLEVSGTVVKTSGSTRYREGDAVMALVNGGGYAEYAVANAGSTLPKPQSLSWEEAAGLPETTFTVWHNVFERGALKSGETLLVHGGASGIGTTAVQLGKAFGARVLATAGSAEKCAAIVALGAERAIDYTREDFLAVAKDLTGGKGVDVILDMVGGDYIDRNLRALADDGRLVNIGYQKGSKAEIDFMRLMLKRLTMTGSTLRVRTREVKAAIAEAVEKNVLPLVAEGRFKVVLDSTFPLAEAAAAHRRMEAGSHIGKIVIRMA